MFRACIVTILLTAASPLLAEAIVITTNTTIDASNMATYENQDVIVQGCTVTINVPLALNSLVVERNGANSPGIVAHAAALEGGLQLTVAVDVTIQGADGTLVASQIDTLGRGYAAQAGPGAGASTASSGGGGAYGGNGGRSADAAGGVGYGSFVAPADLGSGGGVETDAPSGRAAGGGAVRLSVTGALVVDGAIIANGANATAHDHGGGAGGSIWIDAGALSGTGMIQANGGTRTPGLTGGGGGGGRIALYPAVNAFAGTLTACGGEGNEDGGAGTIYIDAGDDVGDGLYIDNCAVVGVDTPLPSGTMVDNHLTVRNAASLTQSGTLTIQRTLTLGANATLSHPAAQAGLFVSVAGDATIGAAGKIDLTGRGHPANTGPGAGGSTQYSGGGGGYGGEGGYSPNTAGGAAYGSFTMPADLGSGGGVETDGPTGRAAGGGAVRLSVTGALVVEGQILANGANAAGYDHGGGAGGSIWIEAAALSGTGMIQANGGMRTAGLTGGGGAGGRIALYIGTYGFTGALTACGGEGYQDGGAGTTYIDAGDDAADGLFIDNSAVIGADTPLPSGTIVDNHLTVRNGAHLRPSGTLDVLRTLMLGADSILTHAAAETGLDISVAGDATIAAAGKIDLTGRGHPASTGPGAGGSAADGGGGGGHGGEGGYSANPAGGAAYGSFTMPTDLGSGGGVETDAPNGRAAGGGALRLSVTGILVVEGAIIANGVNATEQDHGGGAGGSIWIDAGALSGNGTIQANGGTRTSGSYTGGGGAGGRIALYLATYGFTGTVAACGGEGYQDGGAGTVYVEAGAGLASGLYIDACGIVGADTPLAAGTTVEHALFVRGAALASLSGPLLVNGDLGITAATLSHATTQTGVHLTIAGDALIEPTGKLDVTGRGYPSRGGPGRGWDGGNYGGGGGHGGYGGRSSDGGAGGITCGSTVREPVEFGSGGGGDDDSYNVDGGAGGGALRLTVVGTLDVRGELRADGAAGGVSGGEYGGGGAGGSLWLEVGSLAGAGLISARGGSAGHAAYAGGGGGGRIVLEYTTNNFAGTLTAAGGAGYVRGGAGTIFTQTPGDALGDLLLDNGGNTGAVTDLPIPIDFDEISLAGSATLELSTGAPLAARTMTVFGNGLLTHPAGEQHALDVTLRESLTIAADGWLDLTGRGYPSRAGPGRGGDGANYGGGGGHGGDGGRSQDNASGGNTYGDVPQPATPGSGGGGDNDTFQAAGGAGGGVLHLVVDGLLTVDGQLRANGAVGTAVGGEYGGGGAGGSLWIDAGTLSGTGTISANGGNGGNVNSAGGGSGGRLAIYTCDLQMNPEQITVSGGAGYQAGGDGTFLHASPFIAITQQPVGGIVFINDPATLTITASTTQGTLTYQWRKDGANLAEDPPRLTGTQTATLEIAAAVHEDQGAYDVWLTDDCGDLVSATVQLIVPPPGDMNCDGSVGFGDINPFVMALSNPSAYLQQYPQCRLEQGDIDGNGSLGFEDINPFVALLTGGG